MEYAIKMLAYRPGHIESSCSPHGFENIRSRAAWQYSFLGAWRFISTSPTVERMTSSGVVRPARTFRMPSSRRVRMPISRAGCAGPRRKTRS